MERCDLVLHTNLVQQRALVIRMESRLELNLTFLLIEDAMRSMGESVEEKGAEEPIMIAGRRRPEDCD